MKPSKIDLAEVERGVDRLRSELARFHSERKSSEHQHPPPRRRHLTRQERETVLTSTAAHCHICGGPIEDDQWEADHVFAHANGGADALSNYLPAHAVCNNYRWWYLPVEFQLILKLGVWIRTRIEKGRTPLGRAAAEAFVKYELARERRRTYALMRGGEIAQDVVGEPAATRPAIRR